MSVDQIRKTFEAGFIAGVYHAGMNEDEARRLMQHEWKKFCGCDA